MPEKPEKCGMVTLPVTSGMVILDKKIGKIHKKGLHFFAD